MVRVWCFTQVLPDRFTLRFIQQPFTVGQWDYPEKDEDLP